MYILIVLYMGEVEFTKICIDEDMARTELADWCCDNWHDEDSSPEDFSTNDLIEWYFDHYEDYAFYRQPVQGPGNQPVLPAPGKDLLLTPAMCAIVRNGLGHVNYGTANELMADNDEWDEEEDNEESGSKLITALIDQFE